MNNIMSSLESTNSSPAAEQQQEGAKAEAEMNSRFSY
jgi:hypothetical protein